MCQSTLPHGERLVDPDFAENSGEFQSTLPHGERPMAIEVSSIVACFNPRSHMGSDSAPLTHIQSGLLFQSTLPHGERRIDAGYALAQYWFQSTLPHGERHVAPR